MHLVPEPPRKKDDEMAMVDRLLQQLPHADPTLSRRAGAGAGQTAVSGGWDAPSRLAVWGRVAVAFLLGVAVVYWPYTQGCGLALAGYLLGVLVVIVVGVWAGAAAWEGRVGLAHLVALLIILWGLALAADVVLPRIGYARTPAMWLCR